MKTNSEIKFSDWKLPFDDVTELKLRITRPSAVRLTQLAVLLHAELVDGRDLAGINKTRCFVMAELRAVVHMHKIRDAT